MGAGTMRPLSMKCLAFLGQFYSFEGKQRGRKIAGGWVAKCGQSLMERLAAGELEVACVVDACLITR